MDETLDGRFVLYPGTTRTQYAAVCWRVYRDRLQVLLVTSRDTGRWIIPKGWPIPDRTPEGSAAQEAWEEAGVEGQIDTTCIGIYTYDKIMTQTTSVPCIVAVYTLKVDRLKARFPERRERRRKWFAPDKAARKVDEPELRLLLKSFSQPLAQIAAPVLPGPVPLQGG